MWERRAIQAITSNMLMNCHDESLDQRSNNLDLTHIEGVVSQLSPTSTKDFACERGGVT
jgi:hypothetical protein